MITPLPVPVLSVTPEGVRDLDGREALSKLWTLFTKCKESIENGHRLENISWRLWYRDMLTSAPSLRHERTSGVEALLNEKAYRPPTPVETLGLPGCDEQQLGPLNSFPTQLTVSSPCKDQAPTDHFRKPLRSLPFGQIICEMLPDSAHATLSLAGSPAFLPISISSPQKGFGEMTRIPRSESLGRSITFAGRSDLGDHNLDLPWRSFLPLLPHPAHSSEAETRLTTSSQLPTPGTERDESAAPFGNAQQPTLLTISASLHTTSASNQAPQISDFSSIPPPFLGNTPSNTPSAYPPSSPATCSTIAPPSPSLSDSYSRAHPNEITGVNRQQALGLPEIQSGMSAPDISQPGVIASSPPPDPAPYPIATPAISENPLVVSAVATPPRLVVVNPTPGPTPHPTPPATPATFVPAGETGRPRNHGQFLAPPGKRSSGSHLTPIPAPMFNRAPLNAGVSIPAVGPHASKSGDSHSDVGGKFESQAFIQDAKPPGDPSSSSARGAASSQSHFTPPTQNPATVENRAHDGVRTVDQPPSAPQNQNPNPNRLSSSSTISTISTAVTSISGLSSSSSQLSVGATSVHTEGSYKDGQPLQGPSRLPQGLTLTSIAPAASHTNTRDTNGTAMVPSSPNELGIASPISPMMPLALSTSVGSQKSNKSAKSGGSAKSKSTVAARTGKHAAPGLTRRSSAGASSAGGRSRKAMVGGGRPTSHSSDGSRSRSRDVAGAAEVTAAAAGALASAMGMTTTGGGSGAKKRLGGGVKSKSRVGLARTGSKGARLGGGAPLTRTLSHEDVEEVSDEDADPAAAVMSDVREKVGRIQEAVEAGPSRRKFAIASGSDDGSTLARSVGTEISSRAPGSLVSANIMQTSQAAILKGKGREVETRHEEDLITQDHVSQQRALAQQQAATEMQRVKEAKKENKRKMAEAVALARAHESLADPLLPQGKRPILLTSGSEYTDTDEESWTSEEAAQQGGSSRLRQASQPEVRQQQQAPPPVQAAAQPQPQVAQRQAAPLQRTQSNVSGRNRNSRREWQHIQHRREAGVRVQEATLQLQREQQEQRRTREMFEKRPTSSFQNLGELNRTQSFGLLTQLLNPDPAIFPPNHPYRRGQSSGEIPRLNMATMSMSQAPPQPGPVRPVENQQPQQRQPQEPQKSRPQQHAPAQERVQEVPPPAVPAAKAPPPPLANVTTDVPPAKAPSVPPSPARSERRRTSTSSAVAALALRGMRSLGLTKSSTAAPVSSQMQVGSVKPKGIVAPPSIAPPVTSGSAGGGQRQRGPLPGQEMEDSDSEDEGENVLQVSQSYAQHKLSLFAARQGIHASAVLATQQESDETPVWARDPRTQQDLQQLPPQQQQQHVQPSGPIPVMHPYNLPFNAAPSTPRTTRRQMLKSEMPESFRRQLLWERQQAGFRKTSSTTTVSGQSRQLHNVLNPLRPFTTAPSMVQLHAKGTGKQKEPERVENPATTEDDVRGSGDRERRASSGRLEQEEKRRRAMARNRSWADDYHTSGW